MRQLTSTVVHPWSCDVQGHLNTRHYIGIFDDANHVLLARLAHPAHQAEPGLGWADVRNEVDYLTEVTAGTVVDVFVAIRRLGTKSLTIELELRRADSNEACARMLATIARFDLTARRAVAISPSLIEAAHLWLKATSTQQ